MYRVGLLYIVPEGEPLALLQPTNQPRDPHAHPDFYNYGGVVVRVRYAEEADRMIRLLPHRYYRTTVPGGARARVEAGPQGTSAQAGCIAPHFVVGSAQVP